MESPADFAARIVESTKAEISTTLVIQGAVASGMLVPVAQYYEWFLEQASAALGRKGWWVAEEKSASVQEQSEDAVQKTLSTSEIALRDVTLRTGQYVFHLPFLLVDRRAIGAVTFGAERQS